MLGARVLGKRSDCMTKARSIPLLLEHRSKMIISALQLSDLYSPLLCVSLSLPTGK